MAAATVRVKGLRELMRALNKVNKEAAKTVRAELIKAATPIAVSARSKISRYAGASTSTIGPRASVKGAFVTQRASKVTGVRGDFGVLQMRVGLEPALEEREDETVLAVEQALDRLGVRAGF